MTTESNPPIQSSSEQSESPKYYPPESIEEAHERLSLYGGKLEQLRSGQLDSKVRPIGNNKINIIEMERASIEHLNKDPENFRRRIFNENPTTWVEERTRIHPRFLGMPRIELSSINTYRLSNGQIEVQEDDDYPRLAELKEAQLLEKKAFLYTVKVAKNFYGIE